jgi:hypothetical protein
VYVVCGRAALYCVWSRPSREPTGGQPQPAPAHGTHSTHNCFAGSPRCLWFCESGATNTVQTHKEHAHPCQVSDTGQPAAAQCCHQPCQPVAIINRYWDPQIYTSHIPGLPASNRHPPPDKHTHTHPHPPPKKHSPVPGQQHRPVCSCPVLPPALPASSHHQLGWCYCHCRHTCPAAAPAQQGVSTCSSSSSTSSGGGRRCRILMRNQRRRELDPAAN